MVPRRGTYSKKREFRNSEFGIRNCRPPPGEIGEKGAVIGGAWQTAGGSDQRPRQGIACHRPLAGDGASPRPQAASSLSGSATKGKRVEISGALSVGEPLGSAVGERFQQMGAGRMPKFAQRLVLDLPDALAGDIEGTANLLEGVLGTIADPES